VYLVVDRIYTVSTCLFLVFVTSHSVSYTSLLLNNICRLKKWFALQILKFGVSVSVESLVQWSEEEKISLMVKKDVVKAIEEFISESNEEMRGIVQEFGEMANRDVEGGSSNSNVTLLKSKC